MKKRDALKMLAAALGALASDWPFRLRRRSPSATPMSAPRATSSTGMPTNSPSASNQRTEGRVKVQVFPNSQLGGAQETVDGVRSGAIPLAHHEFASLARLMPDIAVFAAPFAYRDGTHAMTATDPAKSEVMKELSDKLVAAANIRIIGRLYRGARQMTAKMAVYSPADLKDKRFRGVPLQLWTTMIKGMGAVPTPVEVGELPTALMTGLVIGQENPLTMINANKLYEVQSHVMLTSHMQNVLPVFINERVWQSIPEKDRAIVLAAVAAEIGEETLKLGNRGRGQADRRAQEEGHEVHHRGRRPQGRRVPQGRQRAGPHRLPELGSAISSASPP